MACWTLQDITQYFNRLSMRGNACRRIHQQLVQGRIQTFWGGVGRRLRKMLIWFMLDATTKLLSIGCFAGRGMSSLIASSLLVPSIGPRVRFIVLNEWINKYLKIHIKYRCHGDHKGLFRVTYIQVLFCLCWYDQVFYVICHQTYNTHRAGAVVQR